MNRTADVITTVRFGSDITCYYIQQQKIGQTVQSGQIIEASWFNANGFETRSRWCNSSEEAFKWIVKLETGA